MAAYDTLRSAIDNYIKANGNNEITGTILNDILNAMVTALGADTRFAGVATPSTNPGNPEGNVIYFASQAGTYSNFGSIVLPLGIHILLWNGTTWTSQTWFTVDNAPTQNSQNLATSGGILQAIVDAVGVERLRAIGAEVTSCSFSGTTKKISFFNSANTTLFQLDATAFVIDGMVSDVKIEDGNLVIQFNTDAGKQDIEIPLTEIFNPDNYYTKTAIDTLLQSYYTKTQIDNLLTAINSRFSAGYLYKGVATPATNPSTPTEKVFYITTTAGTYTYFLDSNNQPIVVKEGEAILKYDGTSWSLEQYRLTDGGVFNVTAYSGSSFASLDALLSDENLNNLIPVSVRKGGMSIKFVQSSDNKYVQFRLMATSFSTNEADWQGISLDGNIFDNPSNTQKVQIPTVGAVYDEVVKEVFNEQKYIDDANSTFLTSGGITSAEMMYSFIRSIQMLVNKDEGYQYGILKVNNGLPENTAYSYNITLYKWPENTVPTSQNTTIIGKYSKRIPLDGTIELVDDNDIVTAKVFVDWSALTTQFGGSTKFNGVGTGVIYNQDVLFSNQRNTLEQRVNENFDLCRDTSVHTGYYVADSLTPFILDYVLKTGGSLKLKMVHKISSTGTIKLNISSTGNIQAYYNGRAASINNTWDDNEIIEVFYDGSVYQTFKVASPEGNTIFDVSKYNATNAGLKQYLGLSDALIEVPDFIQKGGVNINFVDSETGKYKQYRLTSSSWSTTTTNWEEITDVSNSVDAIEMDLYGLPTTIGTIVPRIDGSQTNSGYFRNYTVDLTGVYAKGYTKVRFYAFSAYNNLTANNAITQGLIATGFEDNAWIVESYVPVVQDQAGYCELPITANSTTLVASVLKPAGSTAIGDRYPEGTDPDFVPPIVQLFKDGSFSTIQLLNKDLESVNERIGDNETGIEGLDERVTALEDGVNSKFPSTFLPSKVYGVIGDTLQIFNRGVVIAIDPYRWYNKFTCKQGKVYDRYFEVTPELVNGSVPNNLTIKHKMINDDYEESTETTSQFVLSARPTSSPASNINVLCVGASGTANGVWPAELKRRLTGTLNTGSPAADGLSNITFVGRKEKSGVHFEATGGWIWGTFYTPKDALRFTVTGISAVDVGDAYTFVDANSNTIVIVVAEVNVTGSSGNIRFTYSSSTHSVPTSQSGTLTKQSGSGDSIINYTSFEEETYCPFYDEDLQGAGFTDYANTYCNGKIDVAIFDLGIFNYTSMQGDADLSPVIEQMKTLLDALHRDFPNCKVILGTPKGVSQYHGIEYNYGANSERTQWACLYPEFKYAKALEEFIAQDAYKNWCYLANPHGEVDSENVFPTAEKNVNTRMTEKELIGTNGVHTIEAGYLMAADSYYRCFVNTVLV